jgi:hypothetical protein
VIAKAREALAMHIERLLEANQKIGIPTAADAIERTDALLLAAVDVPDDLRIARVELAIPALSLARIDAFAQRHGLTHSGLFVEAVNRWALDDTTPRDRRREVSDGPTLFDFGNPLELRVEPTAAAIDPPGEAAALDRDTNDVNIEGNAEDITAELARLLDESSKPRPAGEAVEEGRTRPLRESR